MHLLYLSTIILVILNSVTTVHSTDYIDSSKKDVDIKGNNGDKGWVRIDASKLYSVQTFNFHNKDLSKVKITFKDFRLAENSSLRIYDGESAKDDMVLYRLQDRPVFTSTGADVLMVFKKGNMTEDSDYVFANTLFAFQYYFISESRFEALPSKGACGSISHGTQEGHANAYIGSSYPNSVYPVDCVWIQNSTINSQYTLVIRMSGNVWTQWKNGVFSIEVREGTSSSGARITDSKEDSSDKKVFYTVNGFFHLKVEAEMTRNNDFFRLGFAVTEARAEELVASVSSSSLPSGCPYKECQYSGCRDYWDSCSVGNTDNSCDDLFLKEHCTDAITSRCYHSDIDKCDDVVDCIQETDENDCGFGYTFNYTTILIPAIIFLIFFGIMMFRRSSPATRSRIGGYCDYILKCQCVEDIKKCQCCKRIKNCSCFTRQNSQHNQDRVSGNDLDSGTHTRPVAEVDVVDEQPSTRRSSVILHVEQNPTPPRDENTTLHPTAPDAPPSYDSVGPPRDPPAAPSYTDPPAAPSYSGLRDTPHRLPPLDNDDAPPPTYEEVVNNPKYVS